MTGTLLSEEQRIDPPPDEELEVMRLCVTGLKDVVIARRLGVSVVTVRRRAQSFRRRVGAQNRPQAVAIATRLGWLPETSSSAGADLDYRQQSGETNRD